ncbi:VOC family protein [uncultured Roseibium sp.]|uniref:VOC family protein n=1 Tax=uncultured Roseibium sp. TaxID=1936171 RepID=UPI003217F320
MAEAFLEHCQTSPSATPLKTAERLADLFGWYIRWQGEAKAGGFAVHVGNDSSYVAVYSLGDPKDPQDSYTTRGGLNHVGVVVDDLDATEGKVKAMGYKPAQSRRLRTGTPVLLR